jgi:hypothetical protein
LLPLLLEPQRMHACLLLLLLLLPPLPLRVRLDAAVALGAASGRLPGDKCVQALLAFTRCVFVYVGGGGLGGWERHVLVTGRQVCAGIARLHQVSCHSTCNQRMQGVSSKYWELGVWEGGCGAEKH